MPAMPPFPRNFERFASIDQHRFLQQKGLLEDYWERILSGPMLDDTYHVDEESDVTSLIFPAS